MRQKQLNSGEAYLLRFAAVATFLLGSLTIPAAAQQHGQKTFSSPEEASQALFTAAKNNDEKAMLELLGPEGKDIISSGDEAQDKASRANFAKRYAEMNRLVKEPDGTVTLYIGPWNWPYPMPLVSKGSRWYFDTATGKQEILFRRIGRNEMSAMRVCEELVAAQKEYYSQHQNEYAQKIASDEGKQNGLYWKAADGGPQSPIGPLVAQAAANDHGGTAEPYHGYYFEILTKQGKDSAGGAKDYIVDGKMTGGFAFVAYPASYRSSGVMTFLVGADGVIYERDLGKKTETTCKAMKEFDPASGWRKMEDKTENQNQQSAGAQSPK